MYDDEFSGQGGTYIIDPETGKRKRVEEPTIEPQKPEKPETEANEEEGGK